jgi:hypothetical protein
MVHQASVSFIKQGKLTEQDVPLLSYLMSLVNDLKLELKATRVSPFKVRMRQACSADSTSELVT